MFDPYSSEFLDDPYPTYARLREESPAFYDATWELTFFTRHDDVAAILKDRDRFGRDFRHRLEPDEVDQDLYRRIYPPSGRRGLDTSGSPSSISNHPVTPVSAVSSPRRSHGDRLRLSDPDWRRRPPISSTEPWSRGTLDVIEDFATPIPVAMIAELMGLPASDHQQVLDWSHAIVKVFDQNVSEADGEAAESATRDFVAYLEDVVDMRRKRRGDDLISSMVDVEDAGDTLTDEEIVGTSILTLNAGHEATVHAIGNGLLALARDDGQYRRLHQGEAAVGTRLWTSYSATTPRFRCSSAGSLSTRKWPECVWRRGPKWGSSLARQTTIPKSSTTRKVSIWPVSPIPMCHSAPGSTIASVPRWPGWNWKPRSGASLLVLPESS